MIVLLTGTFTDTASIVQEFVSWYQPAFESILRRYMAEVCEGTWVTGKVGDIAIEKVIDAGLYMTSLFVRGIDVLGLVQDANIDLARKSKPVALTGRIGEFR